MDYKKWLPDKSKERKRENDYSCGNRPVDAVALKKRKIEREALKTSGTQDRKGRYFECELCDAIFLQPMSLQKHARQKHKEVRQQEMGLRDLDSNDSSLKCSHCGIHFSSQIKLDYHLSSLMESIPKAKENLERAKPDIELKLEPTINIKVEPDEAVSTIARPKVKSEASDYDIKLEEHACSDCDFRTYVKLEYMDHVLYDCADGGGQAYPQQMGDGWSYQSGTFFCVKCKFSTTVKASMFYHLRKGHTTVASHL